VSSVRTSIVAAIIGVMLLPAVVRAGEWYEKLKLKGDFRHRHELIQVEDREDQNRWRMRARLALEAEISDACSAVIGLASGSDDPVSTNQTMTDGFTTKSFGLDLAYFDLHPKAIENLRLVGGKMKLPFETAEKTELIWDGDLNPEGVALRFGRGFGENVKMFLGGGGFYVKDRDPDDESYVAGVQTGFNVKASDDVKIMAGVGYYDYEGAECMPFFYNASKNYGNSKAVIGTTEVGGEEVDVYGYALDYNEVEVLGTVGIALSDKAGLKLYGNYVNNVAADSLNTGWLFGGAVSYGKDKGAVKVYANYRQLEADAVVGAFTDSDFIGGGTNGKGLELGAMYGIVKNVSFDLTYFVNTKGIKDTDEEIGYNRLQVDLQLKF
jgi:hypothetical protein